MNWAIISRIGKDAGIFAAVQWCGWWQYPPIGTHTSQFAKDGWTTHEVPAGGYHQIQNTVTANQTLGNNPLW